MIFNRSDTSQNHQARWLLLLLPVLLELLTALPSHAQTTRKYPEAQFVYPLYPYSETTWVEGARSIIEWNAFVDDTTLNIERLVIQLGMGEGTNVTTLETVHSKLPFPNVTSIYYTFPEGVYEVPGNYCLIFTGTNAAGDEFGPNFTTWFRVNATVKGEGKQGEGDVTEKDTKPSDAGGGSLDPDDPPPASVSETTTAARNSDTSGAPTCSIPSGMSFVWITGFIVMMRSYSGL